MRLIPISLAPLLVLMTLVAVGCGGRQPGAYDPNAVRFCIENTTVGYGNVVAMVASTRFTVYPGEEVCRNVNAVAGGLSIRATTSSGGGMSGPLRYSFTLPGGVYCWHWRVSTAPTLDIVSCDQGGF